MNASSSTPQTGKQPNVAAGIATRLGTVAALMLVQAALLFGGAGRFDWPWAWVYLGLSLAVILINGTVLLRISPETVAERGHPGEMAGWDKVVSGAAGVAMYLALPLVAALDLRFGWSRGLATVWHLAGALALAGGYALFAWAMVANAYFSTVVRIQTERGHTVCRRGPYRFVRHPGYAGYLLQALGIPFLLGSFWALLPALAAGVPMIVRTVLEDHLLQTSLPGYREYTKEVRYRLVPGIW